MKRRLTEHLAELAPPPLREVIVPGEGFEVIVAAVAVKWRQAGPPDRDGGGELRWRLRQIGGPLEANSALRLYPDFRAGRYRVTLTNAGDEPVVIAGLYPLVLRFTRARGPWRVLRARGGSSENFYPPRAYGLAERLAYGGEVRIGSDPTGRSSNRHLPVLLAAWPADGGPGLFVAMEYSGKWFLTLRHVGTGPFARGQLRLAGLELQPGESLALPAVHVGFFPAPAAPADAEGLAVGGNALRRYLRRCVCPGPPGRDASPPVSYTHWFGIRGHFDEPLLRRQVRRAAELGVEYWVHGPGWFEGGYPRGVGNWHQADRAKYPKGLEPLAECVRAAGMRFGLWFEIEHARSGTFSAERYGQLFLPAPPGADPAELHLNLARRDAQDWAVETIAGWVDRLGLEWICFDYRLEPGPFFHAADPTGGIQLAYYEGLCRVLDTLRRRYPSLLMELSAAGGRRIDLATLRRADSCWISDQTYSPDICRYMQCRFARLLPSPLARGAVAVNRGAGGEGFCDHDVLARMCGALGFAGDIASWPARLARRVRRWTDAYKAIRHLLGGDFHQLLPVPATDRQWDAVQFVSADGTESVIFAFRMSGPADRAVLGPRGLLAGRDYTVVNLARPTRPRVVAGEKLLGRGLPVRLKPQSAACIHLKALPIDAATGAVG